MTPRAKTIIKVIAVVNSIQVLMLIILQMIFPVFLQAAEPLHRNVDNVSQTYVLTLLSKDFRPEQLSQATELLSDNGLDIQRAIPLSRSGTASVIEISAVGNIANPQGLKKALQKLSDSQAIDLVLQDDDLYRRHRRLAVFDMDSTLIQAEVINRLADVHGVGEQVSQITERAMKGELDFNESFAERLALLKGLDESVLANLAEYLPITPGAERLVNTLKELGYHTVIISGGFLYFARHLQKKLGIDEIHANELNIAEGKVTGIVSAPIIDGKRKAELLKNIARREDVPLEQVIAVGDGANDLPMISIAGLGIAFEAKPLVREKAGHAISHWGLDSILYLLGFYDAQLQSVK